MLLETLFIDDEDKDLDDEIASINALADKILATNENDDEYDEIEYDDDEDDEDDDEEEDSEEDESNDEEPLGEVIKIEAKEESSEDNQDSNENTEVDTNVTLDDKEAIKNANELLKKKKPIEIERAKEPFGKYEIIYNEGSDVPEKYTKLVENEKINENKHEPVEVTINKIKASADKFPEERAQIQEFLASNGKEAKISEVRGLIEASLFVLGEDGLNAYDLKKVTGLSLSIVNNILEEMVYYYQKNKDSGLKIVQYGNRYKFVTKPQYAEDIGLVLNKKERKPLSDSILETLAIIAYNQPCTKGAIEKIRHKSSVNAIERLKELGLIEADERSEAIGKPWLYSVTQKFFDMYGIKSLSELPVINREDKNYNDEVDENADFISELNEENE